jgi:hypothetical protein
LVLFNAELSTMRTEGMHHVGQTKLIGFLGMTAGAEDELWITGENGIARVAGPTRAITAGSEWQEFIPPAKLGLKHFEKPEPDARGIPMVADCSSRREKVVAHFDGEQWETLAAEGTKILFAWRGPRNDYWAASSNALLQFHGDEITVNERSPSLAYRDVAVDWRGTFWLATSAGLTRFTPALWEAAPFPPQVPMVPPSSAAKYSLPAGLPPHVEVSCSLTTPTGDIWLGGSFGTPWRHDRWTIFPASAADAPKNVRHFVALGNGQVWCASPDKIWSFNGKSWSAVRSGFNHIACLLCVRDGSVWVGSRASQSLVQQILLNFIFNAAEAMEGRKKIVIATSPATPLPSGLALQPGPAESYVAVSVRDFGCGIAPENLPRVFEPFFTTKALSTRRGTSLGLSIEGTASLCAHSHFLRSFGDSPTNESVARPAPRALLPAQTSGYP